MKKYYEFKIKRKDGGRSYIMTLPEDEIKIIETQVGSEAVYCKVNGIEVDYDYEYLMAALVGKNTGKLIKKEN
jgi:hypothetical protein